MTKLQSIVLLVFISGVLLAPLEAQTTNQTDDLAAEEAQKVAGAIGNWRELSEYISQCKICEFRTQAIAERKYLEDAAREEGEYHLAEKNIGALKEYVAHCKICAYAKDAVQQIQSAQSASEQSMVQIEVCNHDYVPAVVAIAGRQDAISQMWTSEGWWTVNAAQCRVIAHRAKGKFYFYARSSRGPWPGTIPFCTSSQRFNILWTKGECLNDESVEKFAETDAGDNSKYRIDLPERPWTYSALAWSPSTGAWGWATGLLSLEEAQARSLQECGRRSSDCQVGNSVRDDQCMSLAEARDSDTGAWSLGWTTSATSWQADIDATKRCRQNGVPFCLTKINSCWK